jgi:hypothetical protein
MKLEKIDAVIARRVFETKDGHEIEIIIGVPQPFPEGDDDYFCPIQINGLGDPWISYAGGIDSYQALVLGLKKLSARLLNREEVKRGDVQWLDGSDPTLGLLPWEGGV